LLRDEEFRYKIKTCNYRYYLRLGCPPFVLLAINLLTIAVTFSCWPRSTVEFSWGSKLNTDDFSQGGRSTPTIDWSELRLHGYHQGSRAPDPRIQWRPLRQDQGILPFAKVLSLQPRKAVVDPNAMQLRDFVECIAHTYHDNSLHNFEHASHVMLSVVKLLKRIFAPTENEEITDDKAIHDYTFGITSDPLTQFSVVLSTLAHDIDHSGVPNSDSRRRKTGLHKSTVERVLPSRTLSTLPVGVAHGRAQ
jgi:hypothetical protein